MNITFPPRPFTLKQLLLKYPRQLAFDAVTVAQADGRLIKVGTKTESPDNVPQNLYHVTPVPLIMGDPMDNSEMIAALWSFRRRSRARRDKGTH